MALPCSKNTREMDSFKENLAGEVCRITCDTDALVVLNDILTQLGGVPVTDSFFAESQSVTTPGTLQTLINETVPAGKTYKLNNIIVPCKMSGHFDIKIDSVIVGSGNTGPANMNARFNFNPIRAATAGQVIKVEFTAKTGTPTGANVEAYLMAIKC